MVSEVIQMIKWMEYFPYDLRHRSWWKANNVLQHWNEWKKDYNVYSKAIGMANKPMQRHTFRMIHTMEKEARKIYDSFSWPNNWPSENLNEVMTKFDEHFADKKRLRLTRK